MTGTKRTLAAASSCAALAFLLSTTTAVAQTASDDATGMADIIVTAQKRAEKINDVPMSITAISSDRLTSGGLIDVGDLAKVVPGFQASDTFYGAPVYTLRGMGFFDNSLGARPAVTVYVDEVGLPFSAMAKGATLDVERVEVLKGPQGTLFGQNSTGGAVNYIAAKPTKDFRYGLNASVGRFLQGSVNAFVSGPISNTLSVRVSARQDYGGDWQKSYTRSDSLGHRDTVYGRLLADWTPTDTLRFSFNVNGWRDRSDLQAGQLVGALPQATPAIAAYPLPPRNDRAADWTPGHNGPRKDDFYQLSLRGDYDISDAVTFTSITSYASLDAIRDVDPDGLALRSTDFAFDGRIRTFAQELRLSGGQGDLHWIVGGNYERDTVDQNVFQHFEDSSVRDSFVGLGLGPNNAVKFFGDTKYSTKAVFANVDIPLSSALLAHGGIRYTRLSGQTTSCAADPGDGLVFGPALSLIFNSVRAASGLPPVNVPPGGCITLGNDLSLGAQSARLKEDNVSWRVGLDWKVTPDVLLYANASKGYKSGNFPFLGPFSQDQIKAVKQESVLAYEAGFKLSAARKRVNLTGAAFYYDYRNKQFAGRIPLVFLGNLAVETLVNVPKSRVYGSEIQLDAEPVRGLTLSTGATYINSKIRGDFTNFNYLAQPTNFGGEQFPFAPKWQAVGDVRYEMPVNDSVTSFVDAAARYQSATQALFGNYDLFRIKAYGTLDLQVGVQAPDGRWRVSLYGRNVTNTYYWNTALSLADTVTRMTGMPATFGVMFSLRN